MAVKKKKTTSIPLARPPTGSVVDVDDIPETEKIRLLNESGLLQKIPARPAATAPSPHDFWDEVFFATTFIVPITFLYFIMDVYVLTGTLYSLKCLTALVSQVDSSSVRAAATIASGVGESGHEPSL